MAAPQMRQDAGKGATPPQKKPGMETDVLIVGGGLAGLSLAARLHKQRASGGPSFQLLEARERLGGRVYTERGPDDPAAAALDLGPSWFWPGQPRIERLLNELGLGWYEQYAKGNLIYQGEDGEAVVYPQRMGSMAGSRRITGGTGALTDALAAALPSESLHLGHVVEAVESGAASEEEEKQPCPPLITTTARDQKGNELRVQSKVVVMALPPQVVEATVRFAPDMEPAVARRMRSIPTWMAAHAKVVAVYDRPFWREKGLSGDGMSSVGPLGEIHDASPGSGAQGALFGFASWPARERAAPGLDFGQAAVKQLSAMFGPQAASPRRVFVKDWAQDPFTATPENAAGGPRGHPDYGMPRELEGLWGGRLIMASTEVANEHGGFLEGALVAAEAAHRHIISKAVPLH